MDDSAKAGARASVTVAVVTELGMETLPPMPVPARLAWLDG